MHPTAFFHILTALGSILVSASSTNLDPSDGTADSPRVRRAMRSEYKRFSTPTSSSGSGTPVEAAALPIHAVRRGLALWPLPTSSRDSPLFPSQTYQFITAPRTPANKHKQKPQTNPANTLFNNFTARTMPRQPSSTPDHGQRAGRTLRVAAGLVYPWARAMPVRLSSLKSGIRHPVRHGRLPARHGARDRGLS